MCRKRSACHFQSPKSWVTMHIVAADLHPFKEDIQRGHNLAKKCSSITHYLDVSGRDQIVRLDAVALLHKCIVPI